jgi:tripartite-type tricarboxylate transporter receptor subunit TctC
VTFLCPFPAGGGTDILTRILAQELQDKLKRPVVVENRPGGAPSSRRRRRRAPLPTATHPARAGDDAGHGSERSQDAALRHREGFRAGRAGRIIAVCAHRQSHGSASPRSGELIAFIKSKGGTLSYASSGAATPHHLFMELFLKMVGARAQHVPYRGSVPALTDVISGHIPFMIVDLAVAIPAINEGKVKALGVTSTSRIKAMPDLPTIAEAGVPGYGGTPWFSVVAPAGTPRPIIDRLNQVLMAFINRPDIQDKMNALAITPWTSTPDELAQFIPAEIEKWAQVVKDAGITPE